MGNMEIKLSFIVPFYGVERYIRQCLDSLYRQGIPENEYEIICINDCSPDNSEEIVLEFQNKHDNIILLRHETNKRLGAARNSGLETAKGKYVWFVDSDDYIKQNCLNELLTCCEGNKLDILHWSVQDNSGKWLKKVEDSDVVTGLEDLTNGSQDVTFPWNRIYRRDFLVGCDLWFNDLWGGDVIHTIRALDAAKRVMNKSECFYYYRTDNMGSDMRSPITANKVVSFSFVLAKAINDCKKQLSLELSPLINEFVEWRVNQSFKPVLKMTIEEKKRFYHLLRENNDLRDFVLGVADKKVSFLINHPAPVYVFHPFFRFLGSIKSLVSHR